MNRLVLLATALTLSTGCMGRCRNQDDLNVFWPRFTDASGQTFTCSDPRSGVAGIQVFVDGAPQFLDASGREAPAPCVPFAGRSTTEGVTLADFYPGTYQIEVQAYDTNGALRYADAAAVTIDATCGGTDFTASMAATTGTMTVAATFQGRTTCAAAGVENFFIELEDVTSTPAVTVPLAGGGYVPCVDAAGSLPAFTIPDLEFGRTYRFRTLAGTRNVGGEQAFAYVKCNANVAFTGASTAYQFDLATATAGFAGCL